MPGLMVMCPRRMVELVERVGTVEQVVPVAWVALRAELEH